MVIDPAAAGCVLAGFAAAGFALAAASDAFMKGSSATDKTKPAFAKARESATIPFEMAAL